MKSINVNQVVDLRKQARQVLLDELIKGSEEFCMQCLKRMKFSKFLQVDHPDRFIGGAMYIDGCGQVCASCNK